MARLKAIFTLILLVFAPHLLAQDTAPPAADRGANPAAEVGTQLILHVGGQAPAGPLADRFGLSNTVGLGVRRTTASGWRFGLHYRFQTGADVRQPGLLQNLMDPNGHMVDNEGRIALVTAQQRGTVLHVTAGRKWITGGRHPETGFIAELGAGFWEHKIHFQNRGNRVTQLDDPHLAGYDRLTGGWLFLPRAGFEYHSPNGQARFQFGLETWLAGSNPTASSMPIPEPQTRDRGRTGPSASLRVGS